MPDSGTKAYDVTSLEMVKKTKHGSSQVNARGSAQVYTATYYTKIDKTYTPNSMKNYFYFTCENTNGWNTANMLLSFWEIKEMTVATKQP